MNHNSKSRKSELRKDPLKIQIGGDHYKHFKIQPVEFTAANNLSFLQGCIIKRICRRKPDDLNKIRHEIDLMEELEVY